mmetsp:Transcript_3740/g.14659  ORF Transcript_3740/g.14659 Transcript_3740/m.14659 type:complete len:877 (-) Transcript_3740:218-2848(-)
MDRSKLNRALSSDDNPTPGYLYGEIARMTQSGPDVSHQVAEYVLARLRKGNYNTKYKALVVIKQVCRLARSDFRQRLQRNNSDIKDALDFRGQPDPYRGDAIYKRVREAAKEALEAIFNEEEVAPAAPLSHGRIQGFGSAVPEEPRGLALPSGAAISSGVTSVIGSVRERIGAADTGYVGGDDRRTSGGYDMGQSQSGMQGFGNPNFPDWRQEKSVMSRVGDSVMALSKQMSTQVPSIRALRMPGSTKSSLTGYEEHGPPGNFPSNRGPNGDRWNGGGYDPSQVSSVYHGASGGGGGGGGGSSGGSSGGRATNGYEPQSAPTQHASASSSYHAASQQSQSQGNGFGASGPRTRGQVGGSWGPSRAQAASAPAEPPLPTPSPVSAQPAGRAGGAVADGSYERQKVDELCAPGGLKATPPKEELESFVNECETLDSTLVVPAVLDAMSRGAEISNWRVSAKALHLAEALSKRHGKYRDTFASDESVDMIVPHAESAVASVRDRAIKLLRMLGVELRFDEEDSPPQDAAEQPSAAVAAVQAPSLEEETAPPASEPVAAPEPEMDLLGGYGEPEPAPALAPAPVPAAAAISTVAPASSTPDPAADEVEQPSVPGVSASAGPDLFSGLARRDAPHDASGPESKPQAATAPSMFANLSVKENKTPAEGSPPALEESPAQTVAPTPAQPPAQTSLLSFDDPVGLTDSAKKDKERADPSADPLWLLDPLAGSKAANGASSGATNGDPSLDLLASPGEANPAAPAAPLDPMQQQLLQLQYQNQILQQQMMRMQMMNMGNAGGLPGAGVRSPPTSHTKNDFSAMRPHGDHRAVIPAVGAASQGVSVQAGGSDAGAGSAFSFMADGKEKQSNSMAFDFVKDELAKKR